MRTTRIVGVVLAVIVLILTAVGGVMALAGGRVLVWAVEHPLSRYVGRQISIRGPVTIAWGEPIRILAEDVHIANAAWGMDPEMVAAQRVEVDVSRRHLFAGPRHFPRIALDRALLLLETSRSNQANWDFLRPLVGPAGHRGFPEIGHIALGGGSRLIYRNGLTGAAAGIDIAMLDLDAPDPAGLVSLTLVGSFRRHPLQLAGTIGPLAEIAHPSQPYAVDLQGTLGDGRLDARGTLAEPLAFNGVHLRLSAAGRAFDELANAAGLPLPSLGPTEVAGELIGGDGLWHVKALAIKHGRSDVSGTLDLDMRADKPKLKAALSSNFLDLAGLDGLIADRGSGSSMPPPSLGPRSKRVIPAMALTPNMLPPMGAEVTYDATRLMTSGGLAIEHGAVEFKLEGGALTMKARDLGIAGGSAAIDLTLDAAAEEQARLALDLEIRQVDLGEIVSRLPVPPAIRETRGTAGGFVHLSSIGLSLRDVLAHMAGDAALFAEHGRFDGLLTEIATPNLLESAGLVEKDHRPVPVDCLISRFDIKDGVATAGSLLIDTPDATLVGRGDVNFGAETMYLDFTPHHKHFDPSTPHAPFGLRGTFAEPEVIIDEAGLMERLTPAIGLGVLRPPMAILPLLDVDLGENNACARAFGVRKLEPPGEGGIEPVAKKRR